MCGIIGFSGTDNYSPDAVKFLMYWNSVERGKHATGIFTHEGGIFKKSDEANTFINRYRDKLKGSKLFIGHVRHATVGAQNEENAHPFNYGNITGVHNGTLRDHKELAVGMGLNPDNYNVDSQVLIAGLAKTNDPTVLIKFNGAAALCFADSKNPNKLFCFRNGDRTLFRGKRPEGMYISSIKEPLEAIECDNIQPFKENVLYTIENGEVKDNKRIKREGQDADTSNGYWNGAYCGTGNAGQDYNNTILNTKGRWLMCDSVATSYKRFEEDPGFNLIYGEYYFVKEVHLNYNSYSNYLHVEDKNGLSCMLTTGAFNLSSWKITEEEPVMLMEDLVIIENKNPLSKKGDIAKFIKFKDAKSRKATIEINSGEYEVSTSFFRTLNVDEKKKLKEETTLSK